MLCEAAKDRNYMQLEKDPGLDDPNDLLSMCVIRQQIHIRTFTRFCGPAA